MPISHIMSSKLRRVHQMNHVRLEWYRNDPGGGRIPHGLPSEPAAAALACPSDGYSDAASPTRSATFDRISAGDVTSKYH